MQHRTVHADVPSVQFPPPAKSNLVRLGHGAGGGLSAELLDDLLLPALSGTSGPGRRAVPMEDAAVLPGTGDAELLFTTDSFVVSPLFFPGGDIGSLAVHGIINDIAMMGARPTALAVALILEEGLPLTILDQVARSIGWAAREAGVAVVTGDTQVVNQGAVDRLFITTTALGTRLPGMHTAAAHTQPGDAVLLSGPIGLHGTAVLGARKEHGFGSRIASDTRPLHGLVRVMGAAGGTAVHTLRDPTRGGLATALNEIARDSAVSVEVQEAAIPVPEPVAAACDQLGLDVLEIASAGCLVAFVAASQAENVLAAMRATREGEAAVPIGRVTDWPPGRVTLTAASRVVDMPAAEQSPRIC
ncbi:hydrogenase expression/formation protein HypE [Streptomyces tateyamensis]|uniref:Hydrogenase expression/formation protein HypE n=1 Tax=Streptomyces tateyamensis TaxID=565073 RepID=A0A2V4PCB7_9ACTN|nr:hydrogenase expression/formation protein HypE [Streptomyces tateyamensis]PYC82643.1 hydrogenase expression/formation protein HypE [Streptomyces tateyamensis]